MNNILKKSLLSVVVLSLFSFSPAMSNEKLSADDFVQTYKMKNGVAEANWTSNVIAAEGWGSPPNNPNMSASQKKNQAYTAALVIARRNLLAIIEGVHINSKTTIKDSITEKDVIKETLDGFIKGAQIIKGPIFEDDGTVKVTVGVKIFGKKDSVAGIIIPLIKDDIKIIPSPSPVSTPVAPTITPTPQPTETPEIKKDVEEYTSLIVDCRGINSQPAMSPAIFDKSEKQIYVTDNMPISADTVISEGIVKYHKDIDAAKSLETAGKNPLIVKALKAKGNFKSDIIVSNEDAQKILDADQKNSFLKKLRVMMVL